MRTFAGYSHPVRRRIAGSAYRHADSENGSAESAGRIGYGTDFKSGRSSHLQIKRYVPESIVSET